MIQTSSSDLCGDRSVRVRIDLAGSDGLQEMKVDKIEPQKNFSRDSASCIYTVIVMGSVIGFTVVCVFARGVHVRSEC